MKVINVTNILSDGSVDTNNTSRFISIEEFEKKYQHFAIQDRDILVASSGNTYGKVGRVSRDHLPIMMNTSVIRFHSASRNRLDNDYLHAFLRSHLFRDQIEQFVTGSAQPNFGPSHLKLTAMPLPELSTQKRIAAIVSAYDSLIENNTRRIRILEEMAQAIYREWFVHFRFPGHKKVNLVPSPLGPLPTAWRVGSIAEAVSLSREGIDPCDYSQEVFQLFSIPAFDQGRLPTLDHGESIKSNKFLVQELNLLLSKLNPRIPRVWLPLFCGTYRAIASTEFLVLTPRKPFTREFLYCAYSSSEFAGLLAGRALGTSTSHQRVKPGDFLRMDVLIPSDDQVLNFTAHVAPMLSAGNTLRLKNANLRRTRDLLLPKLLPSSEYRLHSAR